MKKNDITQVSDLKPGDVIILCSTYKWIVIDLYDYLTARCYQEEHGKTFIGHITQDDFNVGNAVLFESPFEKFIRDIKNEKDADR